MTALTAADLDLESVEMLPSRETLHSWSRPGRSFTYTNSSQSATGGNGGSGGSGGAGGSGGSFNTSANVSPTVNLGLFNFGDQSGSTGGAGGNGNGGAGGAGGAGGSGAPALNVR